jgi:SRSO17 transposase
MLGDQAWPGKLHGELCALIAPVFAQARSRFAAFAYVAALLAVTGDRKSCWQLGEQAGHATPRRMQALLAEYAWDWRAALERLQRFILAHLADPAAILVLDETAELKKGTMTVGVARQHAGITGQTGNCQTAVFLAYVTARARTLFNFRLYLPEPWCADRGRRERAQVPDGTVFATKTGQGTGMITEAVTGGVPFGWVAGDEVYGRSSKLRAACEDAGKGYVLAVPVNHQVRTPAGRKATVAALARLVPARCWETRSCGRGCKGHRDYEWALAATSSPRHWLLIRRKISDPADLAFFYCHAPGLVSVSILIKVAGKRWPVEECSAPRGAVLYRPRSGRRWEELSLDLMAYPDPKG